MISSCKEYGIREPELLEIGDIFRLNLYRPSFDDVHQKFTKSSPNSSPKSLSPILNPTQQKIVDMIMDNPRITQSAIAEKLSLTTRAVKKSIKELTDKGIIERIGAARGGTWIINTK